MADETKEKIVRDLYLSKNSIDYKVSEITRIRNTNHGNDQLQKLCGQFLSSLAKIKYSSLKGGSRNVFAKNKA